MQPITHGRRVYRELYGTPKLPPFSLRTYNPGSVRLDSRFLPQIAAAPVQRNPTALARIGTRMNRNRRHGRAV
ncbi:MAG: hypothetical protein AMXMBFR84_35070 [Candidatus Hydrogenedentota bacterium]